MVFYFIYNPANTTFSEIISLFHQSMAVHRHSEPLKMLFCPLYPVDFYTEGVLLLTFPALESIIIFQACLLSIAVKGSLEIPGTCSGETICNPAIAALANLALPHDKVDPLAHRLLLLPLSHIQLVYVSTYSSGYACKFLYSWSLLCIVLIPLFSLSLYVPVTW